MVQEGISRVSEMNWRHFACDRSFCQRLCQVEADGGTACLDLKTVAGTISSSITGLQGSTPFLLFSTYLCPTVSSRPTWGPLARLSFCDCGEHDTRLVQLF